MSAMLVLGNGKRMAKSKPYMHRSYMPYMPLSLDVI